MTDLQVSAGEDLIEEVRDASDELDIGESETVRRLIRLGLMDVDQLGEDILIVTED